MRQAIGIPMGIDPAPFWANLYLYSYEEDFISNLVKNGGKEGKIRARHFHSNRRFIDDLCAMNDGGEFGRSNTEIYPPELELKKENSEDDHATFLNLDIKIEDRRFIYKLYDKRDDFPFFIVRMPHIIIIIENYNSQASSASLSQLVILVRHTPVRLRL